MPIFPSGNIPEGVECPFKSKCEGLCQRGPVLYEFSCALARGFEVARLNEFINYKYEPRYYINRDTGHNKKD